MSIPMFITFTRPNVPKYETSTFSCSSLDECKNKLIINIKDNITSIIDYPNDLDDYSCLYWYNKNYMDNNIFDYKIYYENNWIQPWSLQELYEDVINIIYQVDVQDSIYNDNNYYDECTD